MKRIIALIMALLIISVTGCDRIQNAQPDIRNIKSYRDIPGITKEEIAAIEALKKEKGGFSYGNAFEREAFKLSDGTYAGFTIELCGLLSELFGTEFVLAAYDNWESLRADVDGRTLDFSSFSVTSADMRDTYYMTEPVSERGVRIYTLEDAGLPVAERDINGWRLGFLGGTGTADFIVENYRELSFEVVETEDYYSAVEMLKSNLIDAFVMTWEEDSGYGDYDFIQSRDFFPMAYQLVSITTANPDFEPIVSVINKYLSNGGSERIFELYDKGEFAYKKNSLFQSFSDEETDYLEDISSRNAKVNIGIQHDVYPVSFYNDTEKRFEGIVIDVLTDVAKLTGIEFDTISTTKDTTLAEILAKLKAGEISVMTQLLYTDSRKNDYIWSSYPYLSSNYALLSKAELPSLEYYQVYYKRVGTVNKSAHEELFDRWFPNHENRIVYSTTSEGFDALEKGEIDLLMLCESMLLTLTNYREKSGYKVNISFNEKLDSQLGYSKDEVILRSIVDKAIAYVEIDTIAGEWMNRSFDYSRKITSMQADYLFVFLFAAVVLLIAMFFLFMRNRRLGHKLLERSVKLSAVYNSIPDTVFTKNTEGVYTGCNPSFEKQAGMSEAEIIGKTYEEVYRGRVSETAERYSEVDRLVLSTRSTEITEETVLYPDGSNRLLETLKVPLIQGGNVIGLLGIGRDITERREMEAELQNTLAFAQENIVMFERIINTAQLAFIMTTDDTITQLNEYSMSYIGMNVGDDIRSYYTDSAQRDEIIKTLEYDNMISGITIKLNIANGESRRFLTSVSSFQYGQHTAFIIWAMDIEDDELKNDRLRVMQESLQTILDTLPVPVRIFDMETAEIVYVNNSLPAMLEYGSADEMCRLKMHDLLSDTQSDGLNSYEKEKEIKDLMTDDPVSIELSYRTKTGRVIDGQVVTRLIDYKGRPSSIGIIKDLTEEKERAQFLLNAAEREKEANLSKSRFLANMSHEIRTPMNAIIGMSELLLNEHLSDRQQGYVNDINISSHSLLSIINDILDLSKIEAGKLELNPVDYDFGVFIENICSVFRFVVQKKGLEFRFLSDGSMPKCLYGDDVRLRQVLTNICGNAVKFTSDGFVALKVTASDKYLEFEIEDSGMGIRKEDLPKLFEAFVQADTQKNRNIKGTGLGLSISKAFVEMMDGTITVESVYGKGTVFTVVIPNIAGDETAIVQQEVRDKAKPFIAPTARVLVVDDTELNLKVAEGLLGMYKINADTASSGRDAIRLVEENDYDIVFMDHMMPEMDGVETTSEIRKLGDKYKRLTIIALTANAVRGAKEMFLSNEFNGFISKPIDVNDLINVLLEWLPQEKIEIREDTAPTETAVEHSVTFLDSVKKINGINAEIGLSRVSGVEDLYRETLELFHAKLLRECDKMQEFLDNKDLQNLAISVHGMKSSLSTIGAMELSEKAFLLETASKNGESDYCGEHLPVFLKNLRFLHSRLSEIMPDEEAEADRPEGSNEFLQEKVPAALDAVNDFDSDLAAQTLGVLLGYDFGERINGLLKNAESAIKDYDFDTAAASLSNVFNA